MNELLLKYGCNPNQKPSRIFMKDGGALPIEVLERAGPGYINFLDAFNSWQLVRGTRRRRPACPPPRPSNTSARRGPRWACPWATS